jgi:membrane dipeptidase
MKTGFDAAERLHREAIVVDCHNDLVLSLTAPGMIERTSFKRRWLHELRDGGVDVQVCALYSSPTIPEAALRITLLQIATLKNEVRENPSDLALCQSGVEISEAVSAGKIALILAMEGALPLGGDESLVGLFFDLGVRMIALTHNFRTLLADGSAEDAAGSRLPNSGLAVLKEMERLGILIDVSHLAIAGVEHVLEVAVRPVVASHSAARAEHDHHRNLSDDHLRAIAKTGGVVGVNMLAKFIDPARPTINRVLDHYMHLIEVMGIEHVGLGPDFISDINDDLYPSDAQLGDSNDLRLNIPGLYASRHLPRLTEALTQRGLSDSDIRLILGENFLRVFSQVMGVPGSYEAPAADRIR